MGNAKSQQPAAEASAVEASADRMTYAAKYRWGGVGLRKQGNLKPAKYHGMVVDVKAVIPVSGRYTCVRELEEDYALSAKVLGTGMSGPVNLATNREDGQKYAVKSFSKKGLEPNTLSELKNEVELYLTLDHPHITRLEMVYENEDVVHLVMEHMAGGELYERLAASKQYTEEKAASTIYQMLLAVAYLHARQIAHRDLKLENFLYERSDTEHLKLIDFGFAKFWDENTRMTQACGSIHYVAPEVLAHSYTVQADMWSLGILAYMLLLGSPPFHGSDDQLLRAIRAGKPRYSSRFPRLSGTAQHFVKSLLVLDPNMRLSAQEALEHQWISGRKNAAEQRIDVSILSNLRNFAHASHFRRAILSMAAWSLSTEDRVSLREQFLLMDKSKRGTITHKDLRIIFEDNFEIDSAEIEALFNSLDADCDKEIEYSEFLSATLFGRVKVHEDILRKTFSRFDQDGSGLISNAELHSVLGESFDDSEINDMIRDVDTSGDGEIDYNEFIAYFHKTDSGDCADVITRGASRATQRRRTEKLGIVIDQLLEAAETGPAASDSEERSARKRRPLQRRPSSLLGTQRPLVDLGLPTLLGAQRSTVDEACK